MNMIRQHMTMVCFCSPFLSPDIGSLEILSKKSTLMKNAVLLLSATMMYVYCRSICGCLCKKEKILSSSKDFEN